MRIGIDIDGVLTDYERFITEYGAKFCMEEKIPVCIKPEHYDESKVFGWTEEQTTKFWNKYLVYYATEYLPRKFASEVIRKLKEEGHEIYIVTSRNEYGLPKEYIGKMKELVEEWLKKNEISYDKIIYTEGSKLKYCVGNYVELMIEDWAKQVTEIATQIPVFCFDSRYNQEAKGKNVTRVYSWYDIYDKVRFLGRTKISHS